MTDLRSAAQQALEAHANRYQVVRDGYWWRVKIGDGTQTVGQHHTETGALRLASELHRAFHDGGFVVQEALKAALEQPEQPKFTLSCGCPSQHGGIPAEWPETTREGGPAVAYGTVCERHWHEYEARCPNCASLEAQNTELDRKLAEVERNA